MINLKHLRSMPRNVWILGLAAMLTDTSSEMIHSVLPLFLVSVLNSNMTTVGLIEGMAESIASITKVFSGALSDYLGKRKLIVVAGYSLSTLAKPLFALAQTSNWVMAARSIDRVGKGVRGAPRDALLADSVEPENRGAAFGLRQALDTAGAFMGPAGAFIFLTMQPENFRQLFWIALIPAILAVILLAFGVEEKKTGTRSAKNPLQWESLKKLDKYYWILVASVLLFSLGNSSDAFLLLRAKNVGIQASSIPLALVTLNLTYTVSAYPLGALSDRIGRKGLIVSAFLFNGAIYAGFALANTAWQIWCLFALYGIYLGMSQGVISALVADMVPDENRGTAYGFVNLASGIALLPASLAAGLLWQWIAPCAPFYLGSFFSVIAAIFLWAGVKETKSAKKA